LQEVLKVDRAYLLAHTEELLNANQQSQFLALLERRLSGEPVAYLLGSREFYGHKFKVTPATLIPRPETELLVDLSLQRIPQSGPYRVLDLGTGSGAIALSIAHARPNAQVVAADTMEDALNVAEANLERLALTNVRLLRSNWFSALRKDHFRLIVANPPYIAKSDPHLSQGDLRFEPISALVAGEGGLEHIRHIVSHAHRFLEGDGWLLLEHGYDQAAQVRTLLEQAGFSGVFSERDLSGIERVSGGRFRN
jgi:release factor glutamine methyltransferase